MSGPCEVFTFVNEYPLTKFILLPPSVIILHIVYQNFFTKQSLQFSTFGNFVILKSITKQKIISKEK